MQLISFTLATNSYVWLQSGQEMFEGYIIFFSKKQEMRQKCSVFVNLLINSFQLELLHTSCLHSISIFKKLLSCWRGRNRTNKQELWWFAPQMFTMLTGEGKTWKFELSLVSPIASQGPNLLEPSPLPLRVCTSWRQESGAGASHQIQTL